MKTITKVILIAIILVFTIVFISFDTSGLIFDNSSSTQLHSWTKALCNETHCQDYVIECDGEVLIKQTPISGAVISILTGWEDPRNETMKQRICESP